MSTRDTADSLIIRAARFDDLAAIIAMLADDAIGRTRETATNPPNQAYVDAFGAIAADPNQRLLVADIGGRVVGVLQLSFIPGLSRRGMWRGQIEGVRVASKMRGRRIGHALMEHAIAACRARGCGLLQLTTDKTRSDAKQFYESLGFTATHEGMKRTIEPPVAAR